MIQNCKMNVSSENKKIVLELLSACNLNCRHCFYRASDKYHSPEFLPVQKAVELINIFQAENISKLLLTGGEPTLHPDFDEISDYAFSRIPKVTVCTNGVLNHKSEASLLTRNFATYTISIDSHLPKIHNNFRRHAGAFEKTVDFLGKLKAANKKIAIHCTLHPGNTSAIQEMIDFCRQYTNDIVVGTMYYDKLSITNSKIAEYLKECVKFKEKYENDPDVVIAGFEEHCTNKDCLDKCNIFTVNRKGDYVECYWKANGGMPYQLPDKSAQMKNISINYLN